MRIGIFQYAPIWEDKLQNRQQIEQVIFDTATKCDLLVFPELTLTGFTMHSSSVAESFNGDTVLFFSQLAKTSGIAIIAGMVSNEDGKFYNCSLFFDAAGNLSTVYRKIHPFSFAGENNHYSAGKELSIVHNSGIKLGLNVCYDLRFPELYRLYAKERVDIMVNIANWPITRIIHWQTLCKARAIENQCYFIGVNRIGSDPNVEYPGNSMVVSPTGEVLLELANNRGLFTCDIDLGEVLKTRTRFPFLEDMKLI